MRKSMGKFYPFLRIKIDSRLLIAFYPLLIILGKIVRWTIMTATLIDYSKGWSWVDPIMHNGWSWEFFGVDELTEGDIGQGDNVITFFKVFWVSIWAQLPQSFQEFELLITVTFGVLFLPVLIGMRRRLSLMESTFICLSVIVMSVYCFCLSKELFQMIFFLLIYAVLHSVRIEEEHKLYWGYGIILLSASCFRTYYVLILFFSIVCSWCLGRAKAQASDPSRDRKLKWTIVLWVYLIAVAAYFAMIACFAWTKTALYQRFQDALLYASDDTAGSHTYIKNILAVNETDPNVFSVAAEYALVVLRLLFPFELIRNGPKYWPFVVYQLCITFFTIRGLRDFRRNNKAQNAALILFLGFIFTSAAFEVNYGAWLRHCAVTVPLILTMAGICPVQSQNPGNQSLHPKTFQW